MHRTLLGRLLARWSVAALVLMFVGTSPGWTAEPPTVARGPRLVPQVGHGLCYSAVLSPDGKRVLSGGGKAACLWDVATGLEVMRLHSGFVTVAGFSPDGKRLFTRGPEKTMVWDAATGKAICRIPETAPFPAAGVFSPDGKRLLTADVGGPMHLWDATSGKKLADFRGNIKGVKAVAFTATGKHVLAAGTDGRGFLAIGVWDADTGRSRPGVRGAGGTALAAAFSADGKRVLLSEGRIVRLWDLEARKELARFRPREGYPWAACVALSADGEVMATGDHEKSVSLWDATGKLLGTIPGAFKGIQSVALSRDGKRVVFAAKQEGRIHLCDVQTRRELRRFEGKLRGAESVAFSPDGTRVLTVHRDGIAHLWELATSKELHRFEPLTDLGMDFVAFSPDGKRLFTGESWRTEKVTVGFGRLWDAATGKEQRRFRLGPYARVWSATFTPDGRRLLVGGVATVRVWDVASGRWLRTIGREVPAGLIGPLAISPDGKQVLFTGHTDPTARLWDVESGKLLRELRGHAGPITSVAFAPDGKTVLTGDTSYPDSTARLWDATTGKELHVFRGHTRAVTSASFRAGGKQVLTASYDRTARLWDITTGKELHRFRMYDEGSSPPAGVWLGNKKLLAGSRDGPLRIWDATTGRELGTLLLSDQGIVALTPQGYYKASRAALQSVAFRVGDRALPFEQFDLKYNRPDLVLAALDLASPDVIDAYRRAHEKRLKKMGFTEAMLGDDLHLPEVALADEPPSATDERELKLRIRATDTKYTLARLLVRVNGVPVGPAVGSAPPREKMQDWRHEVSVELSRGRNVLSVSVLNDKGTESLAQTFVVRCTAKAPKPNLYVVVVGVSKYADKRFNLTYADKDAKDLAAYFRGLEGKSFGNVEVLPLLNEKATRENIRAARKLLEKAGVDDQVVLFFAGHGLLDDKLDYYFATTDIDFKDPAKRGLSYAEIEGLLDGLRARKKLLLVDTCHAGEADKDELAPARLVKMAEGTVRARSFRGLEFVLATRPAVAAARQLEREAFADLRRGTGAAVIASSGAAESALEGDDWRNGVFTYAVLAGLQQRKADRNKDKHVTVSELRDFVTSEVRRLTRGRQTPAARSENLDNDFLLD